LLRARAHLGRQEFAEALRLVEEAIGHAPREVWRTRVLLQEGRDMQAAERALREVLALDATIQEARRNLAALEHNRRRSNEDNHEQAL
jgi:hypothetical protein